MMAPGIVPVGMMPPGHVPINMEHESDGVCCEEEPGPVHGPQGVPPPPDIQPVIDKMATYVAKNGPEFEVIVRRKNDVRFQFLNEGHVHNAYYEHKKKLHQKEIAEAKAKEIEEEESEESEEEPTVDEDTISHQNKSISFSVRSKENADNLSVGLRTTALPYESSDEEDGNVHKMNGKERGEKAAVASEMMQPATEVKPTGVTERKQAENRVKDKLAHAARDKLTQAKRENQLKAERKRKAAMFINMLKTSQPTSATAKQEETTADSATISPASAEASPAPLSTHSPAPLSTHSSRHQSPMLDISPELIDSGTSTPVRIIQASGSPNLPRSFKSRSRSPRRRSRSPRQRSPSLRHRSRSPRRRRKRSKTPPSSYDYRVSPVKKCRSRSKSPVKYKRSRRHSRSRSKDRDIVVKSTKVIPRSRSRSKTRHKSPSVRPSKRSRSPDKSRSKRKSRSRSRTRKRSRSRNRKRSRSRTRKNKAKKKKSSRSPKKKKSDDKKNHSKHKSSTRSKDKGSSHAIIINSENCEVTVIDDDNPDGIEDMVHLIDSDTTESSRSSSASSSPERPFHLHQEEIRVSCPPSPKNHIVIDANPRSSPQYVASSYLEMEAERSPVYSLSPNTDSTTMQHVASKSPMREAKRLPPVEPPSPPRDTAKRKSVEPPSHRIDTTLRTASSPKAQVANILTSSSATSRQKSTKRNTSVVKTVEPVTPVIDMFAD